MHAQYLAGGIVSEVGDVGIIVSSDVENTAGLVEGCGSLRVEVGWHTLQHTHNLSIDTRFADVHNVYIYNPVVVYTQAANGW